MKRALATILALGLCTVASADEKPASSADPKPATTAAAAPPPAQADSPLVAAAKRSNRKGRKPANVITNETLNKSGAGAHITTTQAQKPFVAPKPLPPPRPTPEMIHAENVREEQKRVAADAEARRTAEAARKKAAAAAAASSEEGLYEDTDADPAQAERTQSEANQQKPPQR
jgi:hypothetical protein